MSRDTCTKKTLPGYIPRTDLNIGRSSVANFSRIAGIEVKDYNDIDLKKVFLLQGYNGDPDY